MKAQTDALAGFQSKTDQEEILNTLHRFIAWLDKFGETSQDQYDFWASSAGRRAKAVYYRRSDIGAPLVAPFVLLDTFVPSSRALVRRRTRYPIADAHYAMGFFLLSKIKQDIGWLRRGQSFLNALKISRCDEYDHFCWGYPFDWETCSGTLPAGTPFITTIPYCYEAFEAGFETTGSAVYSQIMESTAVFAFENIVDVEVKPGVFACSYSPIDKRRVVNANAYRAFLLTAAGRRFARDDWQSAAKHNLAFVLDSQAPDGSWLYAMDGTDQFIDNFHTCFVLKNLFKAWSICKSDDLLDAVKRGYSFYKANLLDEKGQPIPFAKKQRLSMVSRELYDYAEGINLALLLKDIDRDAPGILAGLVQDLLKNWVLPDGHFVTKQMILGRNKVPYHRWAQSQTFRALAAFALASA